MIKILLCALNEAENFEKLIFDLSEILKTNYEIIICIDASTDDSLTILQRLQKKYPITILEPRNLRGMGTACKRVYEFCLRNIKDDDLIIWMDCDNTHSPAQIPEMINHLKINNLDAVVASRFCDSNAMKNFPLHRKIISIACSIFLKNIVGIKKISGKKLLDYTSGYRLYKASKIIELSKIYGDELVVEKDFTATCEMILKIGKAKSRIDEIPLIYKYDLKMGESKLRIFRNAVALILLGWKFKKLSK